MKTLKIIALVVFGIIGLFLLVCLFLPKNVHTEGIGVIKAPASLVFEQVNNFKNWEKWSPFQEDSTMKYEYQGPESGVGCKVLWTSQKSGNGSQTITESIPYSFLKTDLDFMEQGSAFSVYTFEQQGDSTIMKWSTDMLDLGYPLGRFMGLFMNGMMQPYYKKGFENLNSILSDMPKIEVSIQQLEKRNALLIKDSAMVNDIGAKMGELFGELSAFMATNKIEMAGYPYCIYYSWDYSKPFVMECAIPVTVKVAKTTGRIQFREFQPTKVAKTVHLGSYESTAKTHESMGVYLSTNKLENFGFPWEVYVTDPTTEPDTSKWITEIYYPIK